MVAVSLGIDIVAIHSLRQDYDTDAYLTVDFERIVVDADLYMADNMQGRMRFSLAYELGHHVLHRETIDSIGLTSPKDWIRFKQEIPESEYAYIEQHAYEFAGRLLVPLDRLKMELKGAIKKADCAGFKDWDKSGDSARAFIASSIHRTFGVSSAVIEKRIIRERLRLRL